MKLTKESLKRIIKEELGSVMNEVSHSGDPVVDALTQGLVEKAGLDPETARDVAEQLTLTLKNAGFIKDTSPGHGLR